MLARPLIRRVRIVDGRGRLVFGRHPVVNEQHVDAAVMADGLAQVAVRFVAADDEATAVVVDQQRGPVIARRADVNRRDVAAGSGHRYVGQCDIERHPRELCDHRIQLRTCLRGVLAEDESLIARQARRRQHQLHRGVEGIAVDGDRACSGEQPLEPVGDPGDGVQRHLPRGVHGPGLGASFSVRGARADGSHRSRWQTSSHGFSLDKAERR